jgi:hypothetical protein
LRKAILAIWCVGFCGVQWRSRRLEAKRLVDRLEIHHTPEHGSWLNMAEIEFSALARQCLERRIAKPETLRQGVEHWERDRNAAQTRIVWQFKTEDARLKLQSLYPWLWCINRFRLPAVAGMEASPLPRARMQFLSRN